MNKFFNAVRRSPRAWLWSAVLLTVFTGLLVRQSGRCLKTGSAPYAIVSLELAWKQECADKIRSKWDSTFCNNGNITSDTVASLPDTVKVSRMAKKNIIDDIFFLIAYTLFFAVSVIRTDPRGAMNQKTMFLVGLALAAGMLDGVENFFMWRFLGGLEVPCYAFALPATVKFLLVFVLIAYILLYLLKKLYRHIKN